MLIRTKHLLYFFATLSIILFGALFFSLSEDTENIQSVNDTSIDNVFVASVSEYGVTLQPKRDTASARESLIVRLNGYIRQYDDVEDEVVVEVEDEITDNENILEEPIVVEEDTNLQDDCNGYLKDGECIFNNVENNTTGTIVGYALDGFGIYSNFEEGVNVTNEDLDLCQGHKHMILQEDGALVDVYHYHITDIYPYTTGCFVAITVEDVVISSTTPITIEEIFPPILQDDTGL